MALRSRLLRRVAGTGAMASIELPVAVVEQKLRDARWSDLHIAVVNTHTSTVVAGDAQQVEAWVEEAHREGTFCRRVAVDYASHTPHVEPMLAELRSALSPLTPRATRVPMISSVTGDLIPGQALDADYWCRNLREPVRFDRALAQLLTTHHDVFVEASAHPVLAMALGTLAGDQGTVVGSLRRDAGGLTELYANLAALHVAGYPVDWATKASAASVALPTYAFQRQKHWLRRPLARADVSAAGLSGMLRLG